MNHLSRLSGVSWLAGLAILAAGVVLVPTRTASLTGAERTAGTWNEVVLHSFTGADGQEPYAGVIRDSAGNIYGTTWSGGASSCGVVYRLDANGQETVLHSFTGGDDGCNLWAGVIGDLAGNLYGAADHDGASGVGLVYKLDSSGNETVLYTFVSGNTGCFPQGTLVRNSAGNLYGTTYYCGAGGGGVVYKVDSSGNETIVHAFTPQNVCDPQCGDGFNPNVGVIYSAGNFYGTTYYGGLKTGPTYGSVYVVDGSGRETVLYGFTGGDDGAFPLAGVIRDSAGNLFGTTSGGGARGCGIVFKLTPGGQETVLHSFMGGADGCNPYAGVIDAAGNLYGTTYNGGASDAGVVYEVDNSGNDTVLYSFTGGADGGNPRAGVIADTAGNLYGTTTRGGPADDGVVFKLTP